MFITTNITVSWHACHYLRRINCVVQYTMSTTNEGHIDDIATDLKQCQRRDVHLFLGVHDRCITSLTRLK